MSDLDSNVTKYNREEMEEFINTYTDLVNNTEFYKYTKPPSCLMPNNSDLNYMY